MREDDSDHIAGELTKRIEQVQKPTRIKDISGQRFGRLVAVRPTGIFSRQALWECRCDCGGTVQALRGNLEKGRTQSCGCLQRESRHQRATHGDLVGKRTVEYQCHQAIIQRCHNADHPAFGHYGARGISVCDRWRFGNGGLTGFQCFLADMGRRPAWASSIDRIDNDGPYAPENCRWATDAEQAGNQRRTNIVEWEGQKRPLYLLCRERGLSEEMVRRRIKNRGWSIQRALTTPSMAGGSHA